MRPSILLMAALVLGWSGWAWATDESDLLGAFKKFGVTSDAAVSKKPCLCAGGTLDGRAGTLVLFGVSNHYVLDCRLPSFDVDGNQSGFASCAPNGGSIIVLSK